MHEIFAVSRQKTANCCHMKFIVIYQNKLTLKWKSTLFFNIPRRKKIGKVGPNVYLMKIKVIIFLTKHRFYRFYIIFYKIICF